MIPPTWNRLLVVKALRAASHWGRIQILDIQFRHTQLLPASVNMHRSSVDLLDDAHAPALDLGAGDSAVTRRPGSSAEVLAKPTAFARP